MTKKSICFALKSQEHNPKIREGELVGIAIQTWRDYIWSSCGYLFVPNDPVAIQNLEKEKISQEHFFWLETEMRVEEFSQDEGREIGTIGKKKVYIEDPNWGEKVKLFYFRNMQYFVPTQVIKNENNLLHVEIEPMDFYERGLIDKLIFSGEKINQYRDLITKNLGKEFKISLAIFDDDIRLPIDTNKWGEGERIELAEKKNNGRPEIPATEIKKSLTEYYQKNNIKSIGLSAEDKELLDIVFNSGERRRSDTFFNLRDKQKFEQAKIWLKSNGKSSLDYSELNGSKNPGEMREKNQNNFTWIPWLIGGGLAFFMVSLGFFFFRRRKKE